MRKSEFEWESLEQCVAALMRFCFQSNGTCKILEWKSYATRLTIFSFLLPIADNELQHTWHL